MLLVDDILLLPVSGVRWIFRQIALAAERELMDDEPVRDELLELQLMLETGDVTEAEYIQREEQLMQRLREVRAWRQQLGGIGGDEDAFISFH
ncbi:MAG TPA: gas vesicle protein GvpG [Chloroflexota bacterium]|nr:gas vesicle protein GvpG [Chloroflexota bacterium]